MSILKVNISNSLWTNSKSFWISQFSNNLYKSDHYQHAIVKKFHTKIKNQNHQKKDSKHTSYLLFKHVSNVPEMFAAMKKTLTSHNMNQFEPELSGKGFDLLNT